MPTYDYVCAACGHTFEQFQEMSARKLRKCPKCRKSALERQVGAGAGLIFKGTGFYITDYRRGGAAPESVDGGGKQEGGKQAGGAEGGKPGTGDGEKGGSGAPTDVAKPSAPAPTPAPKTTEGKGRSKERK